MSRSLFLTPRPTAGCLRTYGADRVAFLQRQSTNDLQKLSPERSVLTVLTTPTARIIDVLRIIPDEEALLALTLPGYSQATARFLKSRIFFNDKVILEDAGQEFYQADLDGLEMGQSLEKAAFSRVPAENEIEVGELAGAAVRIIGQAGLFGLGCRILAPVEAGPAVETHFLELGASRLSPEQHEVMRIEAGLGGHGSELTGEYTPLETGLASAVSGSKGCYTGQEILARQVTYDKITQRLVGLRLPAPGTPGQTVWAEGRAVGRITSAAISPTFGPIALAVLKRPFHEPGTEVRLDGAEGQAARVVELPFSASNM